MKRLPCLYFLLAGVMPLSLKTTLIHSIVKRLWLKMIMSLLQRTF